MRTFIFVLVALLVPAVVHAQQGACFTNFRDDASARRHVNTDASSVTFATQFRASDRCVYSLRGGAGPFRALSTAGDVDFATLVDRLWAVTPAEDRPPGGRPLAVYACSGSDCQSTQPSPARRLQSVFLGSCASHLLNGATQMVHLRIDTETRMLEVSSSSANECGAHGTVLRLAPPPSATQGPTCQGPACGDVTIALGDGHSQSLQVTHDWAVYASRRGADSGMYLGHLHLGSPDTELRRLLRDPQGVWFEPQWHDGRLALQHAGPLSAHPDAWDEWRVAAAAGQVWLADLPSDPTAAAIVHGPVAIDSSGNAMVLPDDLVRTSLTRRYGPAGASMVPTLNEWGTILSKLEACVIPRYEGEAAALTAHVPPGAPCLRLGSVLGPLQVAASGSPDVRACVHHRVRRVTHNGTSPGDDAGDVCVTLSANANAPSDPVPFVTVDDVLTIRNPPQALQVCTDNHCEAMSASGEYSLAHPGLVEIRVGDRPASAGALQGLSLARFAVVDPTRNWQPVGLYTGGASANAQPWSTLERDESDVFAFQRRRFALNFQMALSPAISAAVGAVPANTNPSAPNETPRLMQDLPLVASTDRPMPSPAPSTLVVLVSSEQHCPSGMPSAVRRASVLDPHALVIDEEFSLFLAQYIDETQPYRCLARADFRVRPERTIVPFDSARWLQLSILGDPQFLVYFNNPVALGLAWPIGEAYVRLPSPERQFHWGIDGSLSLTTGITLTDATMTRTGIATSFALEAGFWKLPRLLSVGVMIHILSVTAEYHFPVSGYVGLNLGTLIDLAGGR